MLLSSCSHRRALPGRELPRRFAGRVRERSGAASEAIVSLVGRQHEEVVGDARGPALTRAHPKRQRRVTAHATANVAISCDARPQRATRLRCQRELPRKQRLRCEPHPERLQRRALPSKRQDAKT
jgi:hypothetical protein